MTYKSLYSRLLCYIKSLGLSVQHRALINDYGSFNAPRTIIIDKQIKDYKMKCIIICHEYGHAMDDRYGKYKKFYNTTELLKPTKANIKLITAAEISASKTGRRLLKFFGVNDIYFREFDLSIREEMVKLWKSAYCTRE